MTYQEGPAWNSFPYLFGAILGRGVNEAGPPWFPMYCDGATAGMFDNVDWRKPLRRQEIIVEPESLAKRMVEVWGYVSRQEIWMWVVTMVRLLFYFEKYHGIKTLLRDPDVIRHIDIGISAEAGSIQNAEAEFVDLMKKDWTRFQDADPIINNIARRFATDSGDMKDWDIGGVMTLDKTFGLKEFQNSIIESFNKVLEKTRDQPIDFQHDIDKAGCHQKTSYPPSTNKYLMYPFTYIQEHNYESGKQE